LAWTATVRCRGCVWEDVDENRVARGEGTNEG
jgi:hypothetical protein